MPKSRLRWPAAYHLAIAPQGGALACLGRNVVVLDLAKRQRLWTVHPLSHPSSVDFAPDGRSLVVKATDGRIVILDASSGQLLFDHGKRTEGEGSNVCFSPDGSELIDGSWEGTLAVRQVLEPTIINEERHPGEMIGRLSHDRTRRLWLVEHTRKAGPGQNLRPPDYVSVREWPFRPETTRTHSLGMHIKSATLSPDGSRFCFIEEGVDRCLHVARSADGKIIATCALGTAGGAGSELAWSDDSQLIGSVQDGKFVFYRSANLAIVAAVAMSYPSHVLFVPGSCEVALGSWETSYMFELRELSLG